MTGELFPRDTTAWRDKPLAMKVVLVLLVASFAVALCAGLVVGGIETMALGQPSRPAPIYAHADDVRSIGRHVSDIQEWLYALARPILIATIALFVLLAAAHDIMRRGYDDRHKESLVRQAQKLRAPE
jgi:hypothetical protein